MHNLLDALKRNPSYDQLIEAVNEKKRSIYLHGVTPESTGHLVRAMLLHTGRPVLVVCENDRKARDLQNLLDTFSQGASEHYPVSDRNFYNSDSVISEDLSKRLKVMHRLSKGENIIVITTPLALKKRITPPRLFTESLHTFAVEEEYELRSIAEIFHAMMYERVDTVEHRGQYAMRGGIVDFFPMFSEHGIRMEFFDTEIDSIRTFDVESQRSLEQIDHVTIGPAEELQLTKRAVTEIFAGIDKDLEYNRKHPAFGRDDVKSADKFRLVRMRLEESGQIANKELISPYLSDEESALLFDYFEKDALVVFLDYSRIFDTAYAQEQEQKEEMTALLEHGEILRTHIRKELELLDLIRRLRSFCVINITQILKQVRHLEPDALFSLHSMEAEDFHGRVGDLIEELKQQSTKGYITYIFCGKQQEKIQAMLADVDLGSILLTKDTTVREGGIYLSAHTYDRGFKYPEAKLQFLTMREIGGKKERRIHRAPKSRRDFINYQDLSVGDYVVHETYGIGRYEGTKPMEVAGVMRDYVQVSFAGTDMLYVPTDEMTLLSKYIGGEQRKPRLSGLGSKQWKNAKARVQKAVDAIAEDLVLLYAKRSRQEGFAFSEDTPWQRQFEDAFPFEETPSQLRAVEEIKADMESPKPMDRLLCGDVGYGKTEVALRAAFKAIMDGKQVAFLCPTTILTQQHYSTMVERFRDFPVDIAFLSRFKSQAQQKEVVTNLKQGKTDIVVGTHRLLSSDVKFKDLGLLIIDEEQRFGVKDKEKIKKMKENIDVIILSATPIPRTLQLSLTGIRDMSLLEEPPEDRIPTTTYVLEYNPAVVQTAIRREIDRKGQIYFVHNRVYDLTAVASHIKALVPDARISIAHGQMTTRELENVMEEFVSGKSDVLLSTTIIETGMDIPNVNTLIVNRADHMGLSQLYQLKGRIGRSSRRSYAYFTYEQNRVLTEISEKRLKAIKDFTEFGSGYKIAMRDLELRGAGNLLGESQSGHIDAVGYDLYVKLLENAVSKAKGIANRHRISEIKVDIRVDAYIPEEYIPHTNDKITMYRTIASIDSREDYHAALEELIDRFGDPPEAVTNLLMIPLIKRYAEDAGFSAVLESAEGVELRYRSFDQFSIEEIKEISTNFNGPLSFDFMDPPKFIIQSTPKKLKDVLNIVQLINELKMKQREERHE